MWSLDDLCHEKHEHHTIMQFTRICSSVRMWSSSMYLDYLMLMVSCSVVSVVKRLRTRLRCKRSRVRFTSLARLFCCCCCVFLFLLLPKHYLSWNFAKKCKICDRLKGYQYTDLALTKIWRKLLFYKNLIIHKTQWCGMAILNTSDEQFQ